MRKVEDGERADDNFRHMVERMGKKSHKKQKKEIPYYRCLTPFSLRSAIQHSQADDGVRLFAPMRSAGSL